MSMDVHDGPVQPTPPASQPSTTSDPAAESAPMPEAERDHIDESSSPTAQGPDPSTPAPSEGSARGQECPAATDTTEAEGIKTDAHPQASHSGHSVPSSAEAPGGLPEAHQPKAVEAPKKPKRLTLQERLALAAKKKKAQKEDLKPQPSPIQNETLNRAAAEKEKAEEKSVETASKESGETDAKKNEEKNTEKIVETRAETSAETSAETGAKTSFETGAKTSTETGAKTSTEAGAETGAQQNAHEIDENNADEDAHKTGAVKNTSSQNAGGGPENAAQTAPAFEREIQQLRRRLHEAERNANKSLRSTEPDNKRAQELERKLAEKDSVISQLMEEGQALSKKELKLNEKIKSLASTNAKLESSLQNYANKNQETLIKLGDIEDYLQKHKFKSIEHFMTHVADLKEKIGVLESKLTQSQRDDWESRYKEQEKLYAQEAELRKAADKKLSEAQLQNDLARNQFRLELSSKDDIISGLNRELLQAKDESASEVSRLETKIELLRSENENFLESSSQERNTDRDAPVGGAGSDADYIKLSENHVNLQSHYLSSQENWKTIEMNLMSRIDSLSESVQSYQAAKQKNSADLKRLHGKLNASENRMMEVTNENAKLQESLNQAEFQLKIKTNEFSDLKDKLDQVTSIFNADRSNYDLKINALNQELKMLKSQNDASASQAIDAFSLPDAPKFKDGGLFIDMKPPLGERNSSMSAAGISPNINGSRSTLDPQSTWDDVYMRSRDNSFYEKNERNFSSDRNVYEHEMSSQVLGEEIYPSESPDAYPSAFSSGLPSSAGATKNIQLISKMSSTVRRLETEIMALKEENLQLAEQKDYAQREIVDRTQLVQQVAALESQLTAFQTQLAEKDKHEETLLEVIGEKSERVEELKADVADLKDLMRQQVQQMIEMQGK